METAELPPEANLDSERKFLLVYGLLLCGIQHNELLAVKFVVVRTMR